MEQLYHELASMANSNHDVPWILWQKRIHIAALERIAPETDGRYGGEALIRNEVSTVVEASTAIRRPQYLSVMNRMKHASLKASPFTAWNP